VQPTASRSYPDSNVTNSNTIATEVVNQVQERFCPVCKQIVKYCVCSGLSAVCGYFMSNVLHGSCDDRRHGYDSATTTSYATYHSGKPWHEEYNYSTMPAKHEGRWQQFLGGHNKTW
jgi:hypothetical protein